MQKFYLAQVNSSPPNDTQKLKSGMIDFPLAPSRSDKVKWEVRSLENGGKPSLTRQIYEKKGNAKKKNATSKSTDKCITFLLQPIAGNES